MPLTRVVYSPTRGKERAVVFPERFFFPGLNAARRPQHFREREYEPRTSHTGPAFPGYYSRRRTEQAAGPLGGAPKKGTHYETLGVPYDATPVVVKKAFRELALANHPDRTKDENAHERFKRVNQAYEILSDADKRKEYDFMIRQGLV